MPLHQPGGIAVCDDILDLRYRNGWLLCDQQMERQCGERARRHHEDMALVLDQRLDRPEQNTVKLMRSSKIKQLGLSRSGGFRQVVDMDSREPVRRNDQPAAQLAAKLGDSRFDFGRV